jgi:hypothetical protein
MLYVFIVILRFMDRVIVTLLNVLLFFRDFRKNFVKVIGGFIGSQLESKSKVKML